MKRKPLPFGYTFIISNLPAELIRQIFEPKIYPLSGLSFIFW
jgi:hypothetical protein